MTDFTVIIPARYGASRLPGKCLLDLGGKPVIQHVIARALESEAGRVVVATDDERIHQAATEAGAEATMTAGNHPSGTDRIAEATQILGLDSRAIIVNVQGDEPDMPPELIRQLAEALAANEQVPICTACTPLDDPELINDPNVVKVVRDAHDMALYFSRAPIAFDRDGDSGFEYRRHLGIYAYRAGFLIELSNTPVCALEHTEKLEQLRALYHGHSIYCPDAIDTPGIGIDTEADIERARSHWANSHSRKKP